MEQETKYTIESKEVADAIWNDVQTGNFGEISSSETVIMKAVYFDTHDQVLRKNNIAMRVRGENDSCFATIKWGSKDNEIKGLHEHQEVNIPADVNTSFIDPPIDLFDESIDGQKMTEIIGEKPLENLFETRVVRRRCKVKKASTIMELAIDEGHIITDKGESPILEIEVELYTGHLGDVLDISEEIAKKYDLLPESKSKYARAIELLDS